jgi:hypothetical protein
MHILTHQCHKHRSKQQDEKAQYERHEKFVGREVILYFLPQKGNTKAKEDSGDRER